MQNFRYTHYGVLVRLPGGRLIEVASDEEALEILEEEG